MRQVICPPGQSPVREGLPGSVQGRAGGRLHPDHGPGVGRGNRWLWRWERRNDVHAWKGEHMSYYRTCPRCGAHLDPGEQCQDCRENEKTPAGATNTGEGKAEKVLTGSVSASTITENGGNVK